VLESFVQNLCFGPFMLTDSVLGFVLLEGQEQTALQLLTKNAKQNYI